MSRFYYDFHIHSCLSPCGDDDMTPNNIVGMARLNGLDVIALTDHNSALNARAAIEAGSRAGLLVLAGMELETSEEIHVVLLFPSAESAEACGREVDAMRFRIRNKTEVYGEQIVCDALDNRVGTADELLTVSTSIGVYRAAELANKYGGAAYPAHADKQANGIIGILGDLDPDMGFTAAEASPRAKRDFIDSLKNRGYAVMYGSDAHYLEDVGEPNERNGIELEALTAQNVIDAVRRIKNNIKGA